MFTLKLKIACSHDDIDDNIHFIYMHIYYIKQQNIVCIFIE